MSRLSWVCNMTVRFSYVENDKLELQGFARNFGVNMQSSHGSCGFWYPWNFGWNPWNSTLNKENHLCHLTRTPTYPWSIRSPQTPKWNEFLYEVLVSGLWGMFQGGMLDPRYATKLATYQLRLVCVGHDGGRILHSFQEGGFDTQEWKQWVINWGSFFRWATTWRMIWAMKKTLVG